MRGCRQRVVVRFTDGMADVARIVGVTGRLAIDVERLEVTLARPSGFPDIAVLTVRGASTALVALLAGRLLRIVTVHDVSTSQVARRPERSARAIHGPLGAVSAGQGQ